MSAIVEPWAETRGRGWIVAPLVWWAASAAGGLAGGLLSHPLLGAAFSACVVALLHALALRGDLRYGSAWFVASALAGTLGFAAAVVGAGAFSEAAGGDPALLREGLAAWIGLGAAGGLLLAAAQAPLTGRRTLALVWCALGLSGGGLLWPAGLALGYRFGAEGAMRLAEIFPQMTLTPRSAEQALGYMLAWLLHSLPFGLLVATNSARER